MTINWKKISALTTWTPTDSDWIPYVDIVAGQTKKTTKLELQWPKWDIWPQWIQWPIWPQWPQWIRWYTWLTWLQWDKWDKWDKWDRWPKWDIWEKWDKWIPWISGWKWSDWVFAYDYHTATDWQTIFTLTFSYTSWENNLYVYINWVKQTPNIHYTETNNNTVTFHSWLNLWDKVEFINPNKWLNWKWKYDSSINYLLDDAVYYKGNTFICIINSINNPPTDTRYWQPLFNINNYIVPIIRWKITATDWQTAFTVPKYTYGRIEVFVNWALQTVWDNYTETDNTTITFIDWLSAGDIFNYIII